MMEKGIMPTHSRRRARDSFSSDSDDEWGYLDELVGDGDYDDSDENL